LFDAKRFQELSIDGKLASGVLLELLEQNECPEKKVAFQELDAVKTTVSCSRRFSFGNSHGARVNSDGQCYRLDVRAKCRFNRLRTNSLWKTLPGERRIPHCREYGKTRKSAQ
jgi:hypothetical protein